jgi:hypothetical protein
MHITHSSEDDNLEQLLSSSILAIQRDCGKFDVEGNELGRELVFERARYAYNDALEFFQNNFLSEIHSFALTLLPDEPEETEGVPIDQI